MKKMVMIFTAAMIFFGFIAWIGGYDFNRRGIDVSEMTLLAIIFSAILARMGVEF